MKVMKFGGGTVKDAATFSLAADVVRSNLPGKAAVVISAVQGVTDKLFRVLSATQRDEKTIGPFIKKLKGLHRSIVSQAVKDKAIAQPVLNELDDKIAKLERAIYGVAYTEEITEKTRDFIVSFGERLSAPILAAVLETKGTAARAFDADTIGMITDGAFGQATPILDTIEQNLRREILPQIEKGVVPIITGFFGCDSEGRTTIFGRGSSDYSAAIVAYALNAEVLEVWKDVPGFMSADPKVVKEAKQLEHMSYNEAAELAYFGAKVLHPRIVEPALLKKIPIRVKNLFAPQEEGTLIHQTSEKLDWIVRSVAVKPGLSLVSLYGPAMAYTPGLASKVFTALSSAGVNVYTMAASMASFSIVVDAQDVKKAVDSLEGIKDGVIHEISTMDDLSLICIVGEGLKATKGIAAKAFTAVARAGVNVELISDGGSDIALTFVIKSRDSGKAMKALHGEFIK